MRHEFLLDRVAAAVHKHVTRTEWADASIAQRADARLRSRTILAAWEIGQSQREAAKRLLTWHWVDLGKPHVPWDEAPQLLRDRLDGLVKAGYAALTLGGDA